MSTRSPTASDVMERNPVTVATETPLLEVLHLFVVGIVTTFDLVRLLEGS